MYRKHPEKGSYRYETLKIFIIVKCLEVNLRFDLLQVTWMDSLYCLFSSFKHFYGTPVISMDTVSSVVGIQRGHSQSAGNN